MPYDIVPLESRHLEDAARLAAARYAALRGQTPLLPARYEDAGSLLPMLQELLAAAPGTAALQDGRLAGFLAAWQIPSLRGQRAVYSPEWANGAVPGDARRIYQLMYTRQSPRWIAEGCFDHYLTVLAHDQAGIAGWQWLGFGYYAIDALRDLVPAEGAAADINIRRATLDDVPVAAALGRALRRHMASAPVFLVQADDGSPERHAAWLQKPANALWLAQRGERTVACLGIEPASHDACTVIRDEGTASITSAFTVEEARGDGVATALLNRGLAWARAEGYACCAVDFEAMNVQAARFWLRHFQPVCTSLYRHINERIAGRIVD